LDELRLQKLEGESPERFNAQIDKFRRFHTSDYRYMKNSIVNSIRDVDLSEFDLSGQDRLKLGGQCLDLFIEVTDLFEKKSEEAVFDPLTKTKEKFVVATPDTQDWLQKRHDILALRDPVYLPSFEKPEPWNNIDDGAYSFDLADAFCLILKRKGKSLEYLRNAKMHKVYSAINALQDTPWRINEEVYDTIRLFEEMGHKRLRVARHMPFASEIQKPDDFETNADAKAKWKKERSKAYALDRDRRQKLINYKKVIAVADTMLQQRDGKGDPQAFHFSYRLDFRGRAYAVPLYLRPQGSDLEKGLLKFGTGKALGPNGWKWLAVHGANCLESDPWANPGEPKLTKRTFKERVDWIEAHSKEICEVADDPMSHQWWAEKADSPVCFLAFCFEWRKYKHFESEGRGREFISYLPIALDGSCNGFQHFSCLLRDSEMAQKVNLVKTERPQDFYEMIVNGVMKNLQNLANYQAPSEQGRMAKDWIDWGKVDRKFLKRNIMALPYGSNLFGFKDQYSDFLKDEDNAELHASLTELLTTRYQNPNQTSHLFFLAGQVWKVLGNEAKSAKAAMDWFKVLARMTQNTNQPIRWITPSGFVVDMDYRVRKEKRAEITFRSVTYKGVDYEETNKVDIKKQISTISANIIHSLDAAHMVLTVSEMITQANRNKQIPPCFGIIHDSYATHAADTSQLVNVIRDQLALMYSRRYRHKDMLSNLEDDILANVDPAVCRPDKPQTGDLKLSKLLFASFAFS
jgi:DNA-directed RNA polymerase